MTSNRNVQIEFSGETQSSIIQSALENEVSPGVLELITLVDGNNTLTAPVIDGFVVTGLTMFPPSANTIIITLKGVNGDTGFPLHPTDPFSIGLDPSFTSLVLSIDSDDDLVGLRVIWS